MSGQNPERDQSQGAMLHADLSLSGAARSQESLRQGTLPQVDNAQASTLTSQLEVLLNDTPSSLSLLPGVSTQQLDQPSVKAAQSFFAETERLMNAFLDKDSAGAMDKIAQVQSALHDVVRLKIEQFISLSVQTRGISASAVRMLIHEGLSELATLYQLTPAQRALLEVISISVSAPAEESRAEGTRTPDRDAERGEKIGPQTTVSEEEAIEVLLERAKLRAAYKASLEGQEPLMEDAPIELPEPPPVGAPRIEEERILETKSAHTISGRVMSRRSGKGMQGIVIYGGILGNAVTDADGEFSFFNVPHGTLYSLMASKRGHAFEPPVQGGTLLMAAQHTFTAIREP